MTGREADPERVFREIEERESLAERYRERQFADRRKREKENGTKAFVKRNIRRARRVARRLYRRVFFGKTTQGAGDPDLSLDRQKASERKNLYIRKEKIVVYSALFGNYDLIREPLLSPENIDYYLLTDHRIPENSLWKHYEESRVLPREILGDPVLCNRWCKMHPHLLFPEYDYSIYVDANIWIFSDLTPAAAWLDRYPAAMFRHKKRDCVYEEIQACIDQNKAGTDSLRKHQEVIRAQGIPRHWGLLEASIIARKHSDRQCILLMDSWWEAFLRNSRRDQVSLIEVLWKAGIKPEQIGKLGRNLQRCNMFIQMPHRVPGGPELPGTIEELRKILDKAV